MIIINSGPAWFYSISPVLELVIGIITLMISALSLRVYSFIKEKKYYYMFAAFLLLSLAFFLRSGGILLIQLGFYERIVSILDTFDIIFLGQMVLTLLAYTMLLLVSMNVRSRRLIAFVMSLMVLFIVFSFQYYLKYHIILLLLLFFLAGNFYLNSRKQNSVNSGLVFFGFYMLMMAQPFFLFTVHFSANYFVIGEVLQLVGFLSLFVMFSRITRSK